MALDQHGRCCGQKVLKLSLGYKFCQKCDRGYNEKNDQIPNWAWQKVDGVWKKVFGEKVESESGK